jgi:xanthine/uracil/vitamin C permease (AzgA family)
MGLNAYFAYQVVGFHGTGPVTYRLALTAVFVEGFVFVFLSLVGMRQWLVKVIPASVKVASGVGIGLFLTEIGMSYSGIGMISGSTVTPTDIAGCPPQYLDPSSGSCVSHKMTNPTVGARLCIPNFANISVDVDWDSMWGHVDCIFDVLPCEVSDHHWNISCFYPFLAVSMSC